MEVVAAKLPSRYSEFRKRHPEYQQKELQRKKTKRASAIPEFIGVDSEGIGKGKNHRCVLIGIGDDYRIAQDLKAGFHWKEVFEYLYSQYEKHPNASFVGFFLSYDFNEWLKTLPLKAARELLTKRGRAERKRPNKGTRNFNFRNPYYPVRVDGWEIDLMGFKRLGIRPIVDGCKCGQQAMIKCPISSDKHSNWMYICDAGPFFQMSLLNTLDKKRWVNDPEGLVCTSDEYDLIKEGKEHRDDGVLDDKMIRYNQLENEVLARLMVRLAKAFANIGIKLAKDEWYGPGAAARKYLSKKGAVRHKFLTDKNNDKPPLLPEWFWEACRKSYFGGWFEIFSHGIILDTSWNYDIHNAYPYAITKLPHICEECRQTRGPGEYIRNGEFVLQYCTVFTKGKRIGAMPYRDRKGGILRPRVTKGWYWKHELDAAKRAGIVERIESFEWVEFTPCGHDRPFLDVEDLYNRRLKVGSKSSEGMAIKLNNNSIYGKFAQSVGGKTYNNWFYASFITSYCRTQILDAIATHPGGTDSVLMVATDGICFDSPHPNLPLTDKLGDWEETQYEQLCLFKPGVYWHRDGKNALLEAKSRGVPKKRFMEGIESVEKQFKLNHQEGAFPGYALENICFKVGRDVVEFRSEKGWPYFYVPVDFRMKSCAEALNQGKWETAGEVQEKVTLKQDSDPQSKRRKPRYNIKKRRIDTVIHDLPENEIESQYHGDIKQPRIPDIGFIQEGQDARTPIKEAAELLRSKPYNEDDYEWGNVWGGE